MDEATRGFVKRRSGNRCEYCGLPQGAVDYSFHVEHVIARQHGGVDSPENLALACDRCNLHKGPNLSSIDPASGLVVRLFDPRGQAWGDHFRFESDRVVGLTPTGRATARLLDMNAPRRVALRRAIGN